MQRLGLFFLYFILLPRLPGVTSTRSLLLGGGYAMVPSQGHSRFQHQRRQFGDKVQWLKADVRGAIAVGRFELITDITRGCQ